MMNMIGIVIKLFIMSVIGQYLISFFKKDAEKKPFGVISIFYLFFSILSVSVSANRILGIFLLGIVWAYVVYIYFDTISKDLVPNINILWFGIFNIINYLVLNRSIDLMIMNSRSLSVLIMFIISVIIIFLDLKVTLGKNT